MDRRRFLGTAGAAVLVAGAGCIADFGGDDSYQTETFQGEEVPLAPLEDVHGWWEDEAARFADTRGQSQYDAGHIPGAVLSPGWGEQEDDPVDDWSTDVRIVTYCDCPHSLAVRRASTLISEGYEEVYALDDGYGGWVEAGYPVERTDADAVVTTYEIVGRADPAHAGEYVHVGTVEGDNHEIAAIDGDGSYEVTLQFPDLTAESVLVVDAPGYTRQGTLAELRDGEVTPP